MSTSPCSLARSLNKSMENDALEGSADSSFESMTPIVASWFAGCLSAAVFHARVRE